MMTTGVPGAWRCISQSTSMPVPSGSFSSSRTAAGRDWGKRRRPSPTEAAGGGGVVPPGTEQLDAHRPHRVIVVDDEDGSLGSVPHRSRMLSSRRKARQPTRARLRLNGRYGGIRMFGRSTAKRAAVLAGLPCPACYDFPLTGPEDAPPLNPPQLVSVTIEYRQPAGCENAPGRGGDPGVFFPSWAGPGGECG